MIIALRLSFRAIDNIELRKWVRMASFASSPPTTLTEKQVRDKLKKSASDIMDVLKERLPKTGKISIALDNWQSPNKLAFMGILG
jgi:hypothetical protein